MAQPRVIHKGNPYLKTTLCNTRSTWIVLKWKCVTCKRCLKQRKEAP